LSDFEKERTQYSDIDLQMREIGDVRATAHVDFKSINGHHSD